MQDKIRIVDDEQEMNEREINQMEGFEMKQAAETFGK